MTGSIDLDQALRVARDAADAAADVIRKYWRQGVAVEIKADATPVTLADREAETAIRDIISAAYPDHAILGEEHGLSGDSDTLWLIDPLDGTRSFVRRTPFFSTQIALMLHGELVLGVSSAPIYGETLWARRGGGAWSAAGRLWVADTADLAHASLSIGNVKTLAAGSQWLDLGNLIGAVERTRGLGDFCHYHLLAQGAIDIVLESDVNILDVAALAVIVREAGGIFTDLAGADLDLDTRSVLAAVPALHSPILARFAS